MRCLLALALAACAHGESDLCEPPPCSTCALGFYGPSDIPPGMLRVHVESSNPTASASVFFDGREVRVMRLPSFAEVPADAQSVSVTSSAGDVRVRFAPCD